MNLSFSSSVCPTNKSLLATSHQEMTSKQSSLSSNHPIITSFYNENPQISFEDANLLLVNIFKMCDDFKSGNNKNINNKNILFADNSCKTFAHHKPSEEIVEFVNKGKLGEDELEKILNKINPSANVTRNDQSSSLFYDFMIMRENKPKIIVESKEINVNIKTDQTESFLNTCRDLKCNGIFISQNSGIINKNNYQIDIVDRNIIIYIHFANHDSEKIKIAFDIIDHVYDKLYYMNTSNEIGISKDLLTDINQEYQFFIKQKEELKNFIKDKENKLLNQLEDVKMTKLNHYLSSKFLCNEKVGIHKCNLCNFYTSNTLKGMAAHKRGCKKKQPPISASS